MKNDVSKDIANTNTKVAKTADVLGSATINYTNDKINKALKVYNENKQKLFEGEQSSLIETSNSETNEIKLSGDNAIGGSTSTYLNKEKTSNNNSSKIATATKQDIFDKKIMVNEVANTSKIATKTNIKSTNNNTGIKTSISKQEKSGSTSNSIKTSTKNEITVSTNKIQISNKSRVQTSNKSNSEVKQRNTKSSNNKVHTKLYNVARIQKKASNIMTSVSSGENIQNKIDKEIAKSIGYKVTKKPRQAIEKKAKQTLAKTLKLVTKILASVLKKIMIAIGGIIPFIAIVSLGIVAVLGFSSIFGFGNDIANDSISKYETYIIEKTNEYNQQIIDFQSQDEDYIVEGFSCIDWRTPLSIIQVLGGELNYDDTEKTLLNEFYNAHLFEEHTITEKTIQKETVDEKGNKIFVDKTIKVMTVNNKGYDDYINWCNSNKDKVLYYQQMKNTVPLNGNGSISTEDKYTIQMLATSEFFFDGASDTLKNLVQNQIAPDSTVIQNGTIAQKAVEYGKTKLGARYWWGTAGPNYFDCSGFVSWCYNQSGANVGRQTVSTFAKMGKAIPKDKSQLKVGDLIITSGHVVMYIGNEQIIGANGGNSSTKGDNPNACVSIKGMNYYFNKAITIRRLAE